MTGIELADWFKAKSIALGIDPAPRHDPVMDDIIALWALQDTLAQKREEAA